MESALLSIRHKGWLGKEFLKLVLLSETEWCLGYIDQSIDLDPSIDQSIDYLNDISEN